MKTLFYILLLCSMTVSAQNLAPITTTETEYNYLTNGYERDIENGREIKKGYELKTIFSRGNNDWKFTYESFMEIDTDNVKAILITITKLKKDKTKYLCLPFNNQALFDKFMKDYEGLGVTMGMMFDLTVFELLQQSLNSNLNLIKQ